MGVTTEQEREFEVANITKLRERYLATDVLGKVQSDPGYAEKVSLIEKELEGVTDWILDVGAATCGESEYLTTLGYKIIANDVNEVALEVSRERCARFGRPAPRYLACDAQHLQLDDASVAFVVFDESLHHMPDASQALSEAWRVLKPGGKVFLYEPYAYNPYRRLSEIREIIRGETVERSFSVRQLNGLLARAGFSVLSLRRNVYISAWKLTQFGPVHRALRRLYVAVSKRALWLFGNLVVVAQKPS